jgi:hypothetical protein
MREYRSTFGSALNHPDFCVVLDDGLESLDSEWIFGYFESAIREGTRFRAEETIQVGWTLVKLLLNERGDLEIWEPTFDVIPIQWTRGATNTFRQITIQRAVCDQLEAEPQFPSIRESGVASGQFVESEGPFRMVRESPDGSDSGWIFSRENDPGTDASHRSLFELAMSDAAIVPFLALPPGAEVHAMSGYVKVSLGGTVVSSDSNKFLKRLIDV